MMTDNALINLKGRFPFRLSTTSYILPDAIMPNIRFLGPFFDEIELLFFDSSHPGNLPSETDIDEMAVLGKAQGITYNVHLPTDIFLGSADTADRLDACKTIIRFYERTLALNPTAYILHFERPPGDGNDIAELADWRRYLRSSIAWLLDHGLERERVAVENIDYPFSWIDILADEFELKICLDLGHLIRQKANLSITFNRYQERVTMMHLHGINHKDHKALTFIPDEDWLAITQILRHFHGGLSLEVFSLEDLRDSLPRMAGLC